MPRVRRQHCSSGLYHVIQRAAVDKLFENNRDKDAFLNILEQSKTKNGFSLFGFCLAMEGEYHLILGTNTSDLSKIMKEINIRYALYKQTKNIFRDRFLSEPLHNMSNIVKTKAMLQQRRRQSDDPDYQQICTEYHFLIDQPGEQQPCEPIMDLDAVKQDLDQEMARLGLSLESFRQQPNLRNPWIKKIRRSSPISLKQIGNLVGLSESSISKILNT